MAPSRGRRARGANAVRTHASSTRRATTRSSQQAKGTNASDVYDDLLAEAAVVDPLEEEPSRPLKRRKGGSDAGTHHSGDDSQPSAGRLGQKRKQAAKAAIDETASEASVTGRRRPQQTLEDSSDSDESDFAFEDVDLDQPSAREPDEDSLDDGIQDVSVSVGLSSTTGRPSTTVRRKPVSASEKALRVLAHKAHFVCLMGHCMIVNSHCNDVRVHRYLRPLISSRMRSYLNPKTDDSQFQRNRSFMDGLEQASSAFKVAFSVTATGLRRVQWQSRDASLPTEAETEPTDRRDFVGCAKTHSGSQDTGGQLFCALLREAGVEARLVCSLQILPLTNLTAKQRTPHKPHRPVVFAIAPNYSLDSVAPHTNDSAVESSSSIGAVPSVRRRLAQPAFSQDAALQARSTEKQKRISKLAFPVFWTEAFDAAHQRWIPIDPIVTGTLNRASKLEPPASYEPNQLVYAVAFGADGAAKDVTRRYAKAYNAKTRRTRLESTNRENSNWLRRTMRLFRRRSRTDQDTIEDAGLAQREAREGLPSNVQDFKYHPVYALERHLRRHEVIHPRREVGKVNAATAARPKMEAVFRRQDVHVCRTADKWFRVGRQIKQGEQPLKRVPARTTRKERAEETGEDAEGPDHLSALYAPFQTELYVPQPVSRGRVPRNAYGNLDIYVPSMVPAGGDHVRHPLASNAANILGVNAVDAVTGFKFSARKGTAVIEGAVVPAQYADAVRAVIEGLEWEALEDRSRTRSLLAMRLWARFLKGLKIAERVAGYADKADVESRRDEPVTLNDEIVVPLSVGIEDEPLTTAGKYTLDEIILLSKPAKKQRKKPVLSESEDGEPYDGDHDLDDDFERDDIRDLSTSEVVGKRSRRNLSNSHEAEVTDEPEPEMYAQDGGFLPEDAFDQDNQGGGFLPEDSLHQYNEGGEYLTEDSPHQDDEGGGFIPEDAEPEDRGGGYMLEDELEDKSSERGGGFIPDEEAGVPINEPDFVHDESGKFVQDDTDDGDNDVQKAIQASLSGLDMEQRANPSDAAKDYQHRNAASTTHDSVRSQNSLGYSSTAAPENSAATSSVSEVPKTLDAAVAEAADGETDSLMSHDPEDDDAEPDWLESE